MTELDTDAMLERFRSRAAAVRARQVPPIEGPQRQEFIRQAKHDFADFAMIGDATAELDGGILVLRVDLRPADQR